MALANTTQLKTHLSITNTSQDTLLQQLLNGAGDAVLSYLGRPIEQSNYTEYLSGNGQRDLMLKNRPVLTNTATVYLDQKGYYGAGTDAFNATTTALNSTSDFAVIPDSPNNLSNSGILKRLGFGWGLTPGRPAGALATPYRQAVWQVGDGNIKVTYTGGFANVPADITLAVLQMAAVVYRTRKYGGQFLSAESLGQYRNDLVAALNGNGPLADQVGSFAFSLRPYMTLWV